MMARLKSRTHKSFLAKLAPLVLLLMIFGIPSMSDAKQPIQGLVQDEKGNALEGVRWRISGQEEFINGNWQRILQLGLVDWNLTDKNGQFLISIPQRTRYDIQLEKLGFAPQFLYRISSNPSKITVVMSKGIPISGTITTNIDGKLEPVQGTTVDLKLPSEDLWYQTQTHTDQYGKYSFYVMPNNSSSPEEPYRP